MNDEIGSLMLDEFKLIRRDITDLRGEVSQTNQRLDQLREETRQELSQLRQDATRGFLETNTKLAELSGEVRELTGEVREQKDRFDHFVQLAGQEVRELRETVSDHERRLSRIEGASELRDRGLTYGDSGEDGPG